MRRVRVYGRLVWICFISLFAPGESVNKRVEAALAELREIEAK
ncbi:MAG TPA: hypothetical protein V6D47_12680 [Oscillatoriaceae cyanobacterium]